MHKNIQTFYRQLRTQLQFLCLFVSYLGWHTLPSHASAEACLKAGPMRNPTEGTSVVLRDTIRLT